MSTTTPVRKTPAALNLPNQLTLARLALSLIVFAAIPFGWYRTALTLFLLAAGTDWLDGYLARRYNLVTTLGRILDPFADKVIICGTLIFLLDVPDSGLSKLGLGAWLVVLVVARELLITVLRSFLEQQGADFSAALSGKLKMGAQCALVGLSLGFLCWPLWFPDTPVAPAWYALMVQVSVVAAAGLTFFSGVAYVMKAIRLFQQLES
jgi:CDP-diacylglycerol--glycerol-3-phosphate 3-phosphatidyltransferase